jgi:hypothetical protein
MIMQLTLKDKEYEFMMDTLIELYRKQADKKLENLIDNILNQAIRQIKDEQ